jgi:hypothetical protein
MRNEVIEYKCPRCGSTDFNDWGADANYDLNVYDYTAWATDSQVKDTDEWRIIAYKIPNCGQRDWHHSNEVGRLELTPDEAKALTLGLKDGDYTWDSDFSLDKSTFLDTYKNIPSRVKEWLVNLPPYVTPTTH